MKWLPRISVQRPVTVIMLFLALCTLGIISWSRIPLELFPSGFSEQNLWVVIPYADGQPRETEEKVTLPIEDSLSDLEGLKKLNSRSHTGRSSFRLEFHRSIRMDAAYNSVMDRMERAKTSLPDEAQDYYIYKWDMSDAPIMWVGVGLEGTKEEQYQLLTKVITRKLERIPGVGEVQTWGAEKKDIYLGFVRDSLMEYRLGIWEIIQKLRSENFQLPSGKFIEDGQVQYVRSLAKLDSIEDVKEFPVRENIDVEDVASVNYRLASSANISRTQGKDGAGMAIRKESDANTVEVAVAVRKALDEMEQQHPIEFFRFFDQGDWIEQALNNLKSTAYTGGLFAIIVLFFFLRNVSMTLLIAACIPFTLVLSVSTMYLMGYSLNVLSLMGLMLAVGMVVDNAIVVVEAIYARRLGGEERKKAAVEGTYEVALAITLSTLTTVAVFLPVILMNRDANFSFFLGALGFPITIALGASLLTALFFTPLTTTFLRPKQLIVPRWIAWLTKAYRAVLQKMLQRRSDSMMALFVMAILTLSIPVRTIGCVDESEESRGFSIEYSVPPQLDYYERLEIVKTVEQYIEENQENWSVKFYNSNLNGSSTQGRTEIHFKEDRDPSVKPAEIIQQARENLPEIAGVKFSIGWQGDEAERRQIKLVLRGENTKRLEEIGASVTKLLTGIDGVLSVASELEESNIPEVQLVVNREAAARYKISAQTIGYTVASALRSNELPEQQIDGSDVNVIARFRYQDRSDIDKLLAFPVLSTATMQTVPLGNLVSMEQAPSLGTIRRINRKTAYPLSVNLEQDVDRKQMREKVNTLLSQIEFPTGYGFDPPFDPGDLADQNAMYLSLLMSIVLVFLIMGALFESFLLPMAIIMTIPMAALGAYWALYATGSGLDQLAGIGLVILIGVVVNNGIVFIELVNRLRQEGKDRITALIEGGTRRFRPILMTALTTICGLLPMAMGTSSFGGLSYGPMGKVVTGGLAAGTILTLFFIPLLYLLLDDMRQAAGRWMSWLTHTPNPKESQ